MAIKNFLFLVSASLLLVQCSSAQRNSEISLGRPLSGPTSTQNQLNPPPIPSKGSVIPVGIYLGPGAMRAFAHIGVLRILQKAQVPIVAIGGAEMGSVVAASFAQSRKSNDVEWQMLKLQKDDVPTLSILHRQIAPKETDSILSFLKSAFADRTIESGAVPFRCSYTDGYQTLFVSRGLIRDQLARCLALPPLYNLVDSDGKTWMSGAVGLGDWASELRQAGARFLIYVDVISKGALFSSMGKYLSPTETKTLWTAVRSLSILQHSFAHMTIEIPMDLDLSDYDNRRKTILIGEQATQAYLDATLKSIGLSQ